MFYPTPTCCDKTTVVDSMAKSVNSANRKEVPPSSDTASIFPIGSNLVCTLVASSSPSMSVKIAEYATLSIQTATLTPGNESESLACLYFSFLPEAPEFVPVGTFDLKQSSPCYYTITSLGIQVTGPREITMKLVLLDRQGKPTSPFQNDASVNVLGSIYPTPWISEQQKLSVMLSNCAAVVTRTISTANIVANDGAALNTSSTTAVTNSKRKRLRSDEQEIQPLSKSPETLSTVQERQEELKKHSEEDAAGPVMSKKAKRELGKQKQEQLANVMASELGFDTTTAPQTATSSSKPKKKDITIISQRRLTGGVLVKDVIIGTGPVAKQGRKVSISYVGSLTNGQVFDKNQNHSKPLQFRLGTGQVIRGLDIGLEGMKVGGERIITIPPELGYGDKPMGDKIPKNSTLVFDIRLIR